MSHRPHSLGPRSTPAVGKSGAAGGLSEVRWAPNQDLELGRQLAELLLTLAEFEIPTCCWLSRSSLRRDATYCRHVLQPLVPGVSDDEFLAAWQAS